MKNQSVPLKENPLLAWELLWFISPLIIALKNAVAYGNGSVNSGDVIIFSVILGLVWAIIAFAAWFIVKFLYKNVSGGKELKLKQIFVLWLVLFLLLFSFSLFKKGVGLPSN